MDRLTPGAVGNTLRQLCITLVIDVRVFRFGQRDCQPFDFFPDAVDFFDNLCASFSNPCFA